MTEIGNRLDLDTLGGTPPATELALNDIGRVRIKVASPPIVAEAYATSRRLGAFLLIDAQSAATLAAGMVARPPSRNPNRSTG